MSIPIIENWSKVSAEILGISEAGDLDNFREVEMHVHRVEPVDDFPNLLADKTGADLTVHFPAEIVEQKGLAPGCQISCWVRRAGLTHYYVHREHVERRDTGGRPDPSTLS